MRKSLRIRCSGKGILLAIPSLLFAAGPLCAEPVQSAPIQTVSEASQRPPLAEQEYLEEQSPEKRGDLLMARGSYVAAIEAYQEAPLTSAAIWNKIGMAFHHLLALEQARKAYQTALVIDPHYGAALNNLAAVYHGQRNFREAERQYKRALKYTPNSAVIYCNLGTSYFAEQKYKKGIKAYERAFSLDRNVFDPGRGALVEAAASREQRIAVNYYLARTYAAAGQNDRALVYLRKALDEGFNDRKRLKEDKEFALLRETPQFQQLLTEEKMN